MNNNTLKQKYSSHPIRSWFIGQSLDHPLRSILFSLFATLIMGAGGFFFMIDDDVHNIHQLHNNVYITGKSIAHDIGLTISVQHYSLISLSAGAHYFATTVASKAIIACRRKT